MLFQALSFYALFFTSHAFRQAEKLHSFTVVTESQATFSFVLCLCFAQLRTCDVFVSRPPQQSFNAVGRLCRAGRKAPPKCTNKCAPPELSIPTPPSRTAAGSGPSPLRALRLLWGAEATR